MKGLTCFGAAVLLVFATAAGCGKAKEKEVKEAKEKSAGARAEGRPAAARTPDTPTSPDDQECLELARKHNACKKPPRNGPSAIVMRACKRDIKDKELRPHQLKLVGCAKVDCAKYEACYENAVKPLREIHFKRIQAGRAGAR